MFLKFMCEHLKLYRASDKEVTLYECLSFCQFLSQKVIFGRCVYEMRLLFCNFLYTFNIKSISFTERIVKMDFFEQINFYNNKVVALF